ncbi:MULTISPECIES: GntR family transcriptional regulator [unclassified Colwellia]|jgi:DNA-binding GntR family transcriptional regulator|uniref:GntR family transcriptional regulator n=1 Tax=unclassified Colwellia TaxID=196834 RepID=UPI0015F7174F|nr:MULTISPECIES: GntR family transcriptional regulator [unclassified Colwellia]MBA6253235.1 GntR family transcriptional regulator [Colwellia sp. MB3u-55]MBA6380383.1 GntR family transcriptional regulator [Colwellia sp. BRX10-7]MBA6387781.1 GntR family transcriptional regulator [Colwellia sp. BRX10-2]MBA6399682.1 GntR family transcriptional regulator [Colwellia sp. BRX10-4]MBA6402750.1 GntR family transcriptional regulator [Colwellia sp. BRX10-5]
MKVKLKSDEKIKKISDKEIYQEIFDAILSFRLRPGTRLTEENLSKIFNVGRTTIRSALLRLSQDHIIEIQPNKGAFIASPTVKQGKDILEARKLIEVEIVKDVIKHATHSDFDLLKKIVKSEENNIEREHMVEGIQLGGDFHLMLAKISKNTTLERILTTLIPQTSLVIVLYENPDAPKCSHFEHFELIDVMEKGQVEKATALMYQHIHSIETRLNLDEKEFTSDLVDIFKKR